MTPGPAIRLILQQARRPREHRRAETLDGYDVHPLLEIHGCAIKGTQLVDSPGDYAVDCALVLFEIGNVVGRAYEPPL